jgi:dimethylargininase
MPLVAITRAVSPSINNCELTYHAREPIDVTKATAQHKAYESLLAELGCEVISLPAEPDLPDAVFVEDPVVVVDEVAVILHMGAASRRPEARTLADMLSRYRPLKYLTAPGTMDGGDVLRIGRKIFAGLTNRTNEQGIAQLRDILRPYGYEVQSVEVKNCLHLKTACSYIGNNAILINRSFIDAGLFQQFELLDVPADEPNAANVLFVNDVILIPESFSTTRALLHQRGFKARSIDISELQKAESGITCSSVILSNDGT